MSCYDDQGTGANHSLDFIPLEFTREELQKLHAKAMELVQFGVMDITRRDLLEDLAETLDLLDALAARDELDLKELGEKISKHISVSNTMTTPPLPPCGLDCPYHPHIY